jgi:hypothetical protein
MRPDDPRVRCPRQHRPAVEGLEARKLLSATASPTVATHLGAHPATALIQARAQAAATRSESPTAGNLAHVDSPNGLLGSRPPGPFLNPKVIQRYAELLYPPGSPTGSPTPREIKRQTFTARWIGEYTIGPPRFSDRASTIHAWSKSGGSNQFLKGKLNLVLFPPADPGATPTPGNPYANQVTGTIGLFNQNLLQSSGVLVLDPSGTLSPGAGPRSLPTHLTWSYDSNTSAGPYAAPIYFLQGAGALDIRWIPDAHPLPGTMGSGRAIFTFQGLINASQLVSPISKFIS